MPLATLNGLSLYYETHGEGPPLVLLHGGLGPLTLFAAMVPPLAQRHQVIAVELQGHGHTADIDRPLRYETLADDVAALVRHLGHPSVDIMGFSLGGGVALQVALRHPALVRKLVVVSAPFRHLGWLPEIRAAMAQVSAALLPAFENGPIYQAYAAVAPDPAHFAALLDKLGELMRQPYDWSAQVAQIAAPMLLIVGDADSIPPQEAAAMFATLGGGQKDGGWMRENCIASQLAILPATTHYSMASSPLVAPLALAFLAQ